MNDPLFTNKLAFAALASALLIFGIPILVDRLIGEPHHVGHHGDDHGEGEKSAWPFPHFPEMEMTGGSAPAEDKPPFDLGAALLSANAGSGERRSAICASCHTFEEGGAQGTGPNLYDIVGREVGSVAGFNYSGALKELGGVWTYERLDGYLKNSQAWLPGTAMVQRFPRDDQRADLLAYLGSLSDDPVPFPEPAAVEPEAPAEESLTDANEQDAELDQAMEATEDAMDDAEEAVDQVTDDE